MDNSQAPHRPPTLLHRPQAASPCSRPVAFGAGLGRASCPPEAAARTIGAACQRQIYLSARRFLAPNRHNNTPKRCESQSGFSGKEVRRLKGCGSRTLYAACRARRNQKRHRPLPSRLDRAWRAADSGMNLPSRSKAGGGNARRQLSAHCPGRSLCSPAVASFAGDYAARGDSAEALKPLVRKGCCGFQVDVCGSCSSHFRELFSAPGSSVKQKPRLAGFRNDYLWHSATAFSSSVPQVFNQARTSCPVRCRPVSW